MHSKQSYFILVEFQQMSSPSSRPISPWSTSSSSAGIFLTIYYIYVSQLMILFESVNSWTVGIGIYMFKLNMGKCSFKY